MANYVIAHDLGTTGNKATLYDSEGHLRGSAFHGYQTEYAHTGWAEQNPQDWWQAVCTSTRKLLQQTAVQPDDVACIVFSGQMMGCVALDKAARPLHNAIIWADQRSVEQERWLGERIAPDQVYRITGHRLSASYSLCKMLWLRDHKPDVYRATHKFVHAKDAMVARLTGVFVTDPTDASGMNLYDLEQGGWSPSIIEAAQLDPNQLPDLRPSIEVVGGVLASVADEVGVAPGTPVVIGGGDGMCASTGAGVIREGVAYNYIGSSSWIGLATPRPVLDPSYRTFTWAPMVPGVFGPMGTMQAAGASYQWMRDHLCSDEVEAGQTLDISPYELMNFQADKSPVGANGLLFLPYLMGERSPRWNPRARGAFIGLTVRHTRADMIRAVLEGVTMNLHVIQEALTAQGAKIDAMRVIGGGARGQSWNRIMANIYGVPVHRLAILEEATSMGAALAGGVGVGLYPDFSMIEHMNPVVEVIEPDPESHARYQQFFPIFEACYQALVPIYDLIAEAQ
ncbi:MAG: FGGY-family carbohydrate kinase [Anaerolineae bacterium]|nr:FGGY-family carbohydrate kinase [Anaerolineae bacterium]